MEASMKFSLKKILDVKKSLKKQVLLFAIVPMILGVILFSSLIVEDVASKGEASIKNYKETLLSLEKENLRNYTDLVFNTIKGLEARQAIEAVKKMRSGESGYFWINDMGLPYPKMIMHPTIPSLDGKILDDAKFNCALGRKENLFQAFVETCKAEGEGFVDYEWPKPTGNGLTEEKPKLSYVRLYKPFNWVIGTGVYIDDIDSMMSKERGRIRTRITSLVTKTALISMLIIGGFYFFVTYFVGRYMNRPIALVTAAMKDHSSDLTVRVPIETKNEIGEIAHWFNSYTESLHSIIKKVSGATMGLNSYAIEIAAAVGQEAVTASQQAAAVAEITSTMEELSASSSLIADHSKSVVDVATKTWEDTKKGSTAVESMIIKMKEISEDNRSNIQEIVELGRKSKEISKVMEIINTIADQTKLIAFNAALEASSAGEAGKRFGVVAVEIRRLADSVMESTGEIEEKVNEIQEAINRLVISSEKSSKGINDGMEYSNQTDMILSDIVDAAHTTTDAAKQISLSTQQQKTASNQVVTALREIVAGSGQTTDTINQINSISKEMAKLSKELSELVKKFKLQESSGT
jgi:methyl-accepting chemotaxis protein